VRFFMPADDSIAVALIDDEQAIRKGLGLLIRGTPGYRCVGTFITVEEARRRLGRDLPDVLLLDINLPGISGSEGARVLHEEYPSVQILMLTVYDEDSHIFESMCNGASGYLLKRTPPGELLEAIRDVHQGGAPMSPEVARKVVQLFRKTKPVKRIDHDLTPHEIRLLGFLADGYSYQAAADRLHVSINTIRDYVRSIYDKLHVHSKTEAVRKALQAGIIS
jgi:DNA-binding NarL/FixJ family response regulator